MLLYSCFSLLRCASYFLFLLFILFGCVMLLKKKEMHAVQVSWSRQNKHIVWPCLKNVFLSQQTHSSKCAFPFFERKLLHERVDVSMLWHAWCCVCVGAAAVLSVMASRPQGDHRASGALGQPSKQLRHQQQQRCLRRCHLQQGAGPGADA